MVSDHSAKSIESIQTAVLRQTRDFDDYVDLTLHAPFLHMGAVHAHKDVVDLVRGDVDSNLIGLLADVKWSGTSSVTTIEHWFTVGSQAMSCQLVCARSIQYEGLFIDRAFE